MKVRSLPRLISEELATVLCGGNPWLWAPPSVARAEKPLWDWHILEGALREHAHFDALANAIDRGGRNPIAPPSLPQQSVVYLIEGLGHGVVKIGYTIRVRERLRRLALMSPARLRLVAYKSGGRSFEADLHQRFAGDRSHGEWFRFSPEIYRLASEWNAARRAKSAAGPTFRSGDHSWSQAA